MTKTNRPQSLKDLLLYLQETPSPNLYVKSPRAVALSFKLKQDGVLEFETEEGKIWSIPIKSDGITDEPLEPGFLFSAKVAKFTHLMGKEKIEYHYVA